MNTSELSGPALDRLVAEALGLDVCDKANDPASPFRVRMPDSENWVRFHPSQIATEGDPVLAQARILTVNRLGAGEFAGQPSPAVWKATSPDGKIQAAGTTHLEAGMRVFVEMNRKAG